MKTNFVTRPWTPSKDESTSRFELENGSKSRKIEFLAQPQHLPLHQHLYWLVEIDLAATHGDLIGIEEAIQEATAKHNKFLVELGLPELP